MERRELRWRSWHPVGVREMVELIEVDHLQAPAFAIASASVDLPLFDGPMMQMRVPSSFSVMRGIAPRGMYYACGWGFTTDGGGGSRLNVPPLMLPGMASCARTAAPMRWSMQASRTVLVRGLCATQVRAAGQASASMSASPLETVMRQAFSSLPSRSSDRRRREKVAAGDLYVRLRRRGGRGGELGEEEGEQHRRARVSGGPSARASRGPSCRRRGALPAPAWAAGCSRGARGTTW